MDWYYAAGGGRFGPFDQEAFERLVSQGQITGVTLVWHDGMDDWVQYQILAGPTTAEPGDIPPALVQCSQCRRQGAGDDMVRYQGHWICSECKDTFYQRVREGSFAPEDPAGTGRQRFAGFWIRVGASMLDGLILFVANRAIISLTDTDNPNSPLGLQILVIIIQLVIGISYVTCFLGKYGATPGKMACSLKVIVSNGQRISYWRAFGRYWGVFLSGMIPYFSAAIAGGITLAIMLANADRRGTDPLDALARLGPGIIVVVIVGLVVGLVMSFPFYMVGFTRQKCALHDFICNTRVIHTR